MSDRSESVRAEQLNIQLANHGAVQVFIKLHAAKLPTTDAPSFAYLRVKNPTTLALHAEEDYTFEFTRVFGERTPPAALYNETVKSATGIFLSGVHTNIFFFGCSGSGRGTTMFGTTEPNAMGLLPYAVDDILAHLLRNLPTAVLKLALVQIHKDHVYDLLAEETTPRLVSLSEHATDETAPVLHGLEERDIRSLQDLANALVLRKQKPDPQTRKQNHYVATFRISSELPANERTSLSLRQLHSARFTFVLLAPVDQLKSNSNSVAKSIQRSYNALSTVFMHFNQGDSEEVIPYRYSTLTHVLKDRLRRGSCNLLFNMLTTDHERFAETLETLKFASRAKYHPPSPSTSVSAGSQHVGSTYASKVGVASNSSPITAPKMSTPSQQQTEFPVFRRHSPIKDTAASRSMHDSAYSSQMPAHSYHVAAPTIDTNGHTPQHRSYTSSPTRIPSALTTTTPVFPKDDLVYSELLACQDKLTKSITERTALRARLRQVEQDLKASIEREQALRASAIAREADIKQVASERDTVLGDLDKLRTELETAHRRIEELSTNRDKEKDEIAARQAALKQAFEDLRSQLQTVAAERDAYADKCQQLETSVAASREEAQRASAETTAAMQEAVRWRESREQFRRKFLQLKQIVKKLAAKPPKESVETQTETQPISEENSVNGSDALAALKRELANQHEVATRNIKQLETQLASAQSERAALEAALQAERDKRVRELQETAAVFESQLKEFREELEGVRQRNSTEQREVASEWHRAVEALEAALCVKGSPSRNAGGSDDDSAAVHVESVHKALLHSLEKSHEELHVALREKELYRMQAEAKEKEVQRLMTETKELYRTIELLEKRGNNP